MTRRLAVTLLSVTLTLSLLLAGLEAQAVRAAPSRYLFGVINNIGDPAHISDEWGRGVRATTLELQWKRYEPQQGVYDTSYIAQLQQLMRTYKAGGWFVQLVPGIHYAPNWVFDSFPDMYYVNQYGERYDPDAADDSDFRAINAPFNPQARTLIADYLARVFSDFDQSNPALRFDSVRVGGGVQGELRYPPQSWNGYANSYWAFDQHAQDPAISGIPTSVIGWRPGIDPNPGSQDRGQLIVNPGFESVRDHYPTPAWSPDDPVEAQVTLAEPHSGARALELGINTPHRIHQYVRVEPSTTYEASGWMRSAGGEGYARFFLEQYGTNHEPVPGAPYLKLESSGGEWSHQSGTLTTSSTTRYLKVELDGDRPGIVFFDDLSLKREGDEDTRNRDIDVPLAFYDWYVAKLTDYQNWQITQIRRYTEAQLDILYAGKGIRRNQVTDALTNDLSGDGWSEISSALYAGAVYQRHVAGLDIDGPIALYLTGIDQPPPGLVDDNSPYPSDWSAARWIAHLAKSRGLAVWGENRGENSAAEMEVTARRMHANGFAGLMWGFESELYGGGDYATIDDYEAIIAHYANLKTIMIPALHKRSTAPAGVGPCLSGDWSRVVNRCADLFPAGFESYCPGLVPSSGTFGRFVMCLVSAIIG